jgi:hypothetical protein
VLRTGGKDDADGRQRRPRLPPPGAAAERARPRCGSGARGDREQVARPLDLELEVAAHGVYLVGCARMAARSGR